MLACALVLAKLIRPPDALFEDVEELSQRWTIQAQQQISLMFLVGRGESEPASIFDDDVPMEVPLSVEACATIRRRAHRLAERSLRAFIGQVQPTFDWTLRERSTGQPLTAALIHALPRRQPVALAFERLFASATDLHQQHRYTLDDYNEGADVLDVAAALLLTAHDRESTVILGDPTVTLPAQP